MDTVEVIVLAIPTTITSIGGCIAAVIAAKNSGQANTKGAENKESLESVEATVKTGHDKLDNIEKAVNGH